MTPLEIGKELEELETRLDRLRIKYELYFQGIEKLVPFVARKDVERRFTTLHKEPIRNSGLRFRFNTLVQRWTSYQTHWGRILRQIEEGTYERHLARAKRLLDRVERQERAAQSADKPKGEEVYELHDDELLEDDAESGYDLHRETIDLPDMGDILPPPQPGPTTLRPASSAAIKAPETSDFLDFRRSSKPAEAPVAQPVAAAKPAEVPVVVPAPLANPSSRVPSATPLAGTPAVGPVKPGGSPFGALRAPTPARGTGYVPRPLGAPGGPPVPNRPPTGAMPAPARPVTAAPSAPAEDPAMRALYQRYVDARKQTGESSEVRFESVAKQVRESLPKLEAQYQGAEVKFDVSIKDGKAVLRPVVTVKKPK